LTRQATILALMAGLAFVLAACGGSASASPSSEGGASIEPGASTEPAASTEGGGGGGGGGSVPEGFESRLVPPSSTVILTQSAGDTTTVIFHSTASYDELKSFYEAAIASLGGETFKQEVSGSLTIGWGDEAAGTAGLLTVIPSSEGGGNDVSVTTAIGG
jgi:hypothetical protein